MQIVIDIPEEAYKLLQTDGVDWLGAEHILDAVAKGKPLPNHHGDLKDVDSFDYSCRYIGGDCIGNCYTCNDRMVLFREIQDSPTIIPATEV